MYSFSKSHPIGPKVLLKANLNRITPSRTTTFSPEATITSNFPSWFGFKPIVSSVWVQIKLLEHFVLLFLRLIFLSPFLHPHHEDFFTHMPRPVLFIGTKTKAFLSSFCQFFWSHLLNGCRLSSVGHFFSWNSWSYEDWHYLFMWHLYGFIFIQAR